MFKTRNPRHPLATLFFPIAALGPAVLFGIMWRWLNADFLPHIGEGADSLHSSCLAGIAFWVWSYSELLAALQDRPEAATVKVHAKRVTWYLLASVIAIPGGRIAFSILPPWDNSIGAVLGLVLGLLYVGWIFNAKEKGRFIHSRGTVLLSEEEARQRIKAFQAGSEPRIKWAGFDLPGEIAEGNLLTAGAIGTGKTRMHRELMRSVISSILPGSDRRALIYDVKCDLLSELSTMKPASKVIVFNPFDKRSVAWDIAADVNGPEEAEHFAEALILPGKDDPNGFFCTAARSIVAGVIDSLNRDHPKDWTLRRLILLMATQPRLERVLAGSDLVDEYFSPPDTFSNIKNTIANATRKLRRVAALWEHTEDKMSLREWVETGDSILVLGGKENLRASLEPLNRVAFKMISADFLSEDESPRRSRLWFFCDELKTAGRLDSLPELMNARSKGVRCVLGFQDIEGLVKAYGGDRETPKEILNRCTTASWLRLTSTDTADWAAKRTGELERYEYLETRNKDDEKSTGEHLAKREAFLSSQFQNLQDFASGNCHGIHIIKGVGGPFPATAHYEFPGKTVVLDFDARPKSEQLLERWGPDDDKWFDGGDGEPQTTQKPEDPDLGSLGRIDF